MAKRKPSRPRRKVAKKAKTSLGKAKSAADTQLSTSTALSRLSDCDSRLALNTDPFCQDFVQIARLLGVEGFEKKKAVRRGPVDGRPLVAAGADPELVRDMIFCAMAANLSDIKPGSANGLLGAATDLTQMIWADYKNEQLRRCRVAGHPACKDVELALVINYRQCWKPVGYTRGELLNSLSLAPGEELTVEFFTWDRHKIERERSLETARESNESGTVTSRASMEVVSNVGFKVGAGADASVNGSVALKDMDIPVDLGGEIGANFSTEMTFGLTTTSNRLNEATRSASNTLRAMRKTRVAETHEFGSETRNTRKIKNENFCHTINYDYFEILEHYEVTVQVVGADYVALVPLPHPGPINAAWILCHEHPLRRYLLDIVYEAGFDAAKLIRTADIFRSQSEQTAAPAVPPPAPADSSGSGSDSDSVDDPLKDHLAPLVDEIVAAADRLKSASLSGDDIGDLFSWYQSTRERAFKKAQKYATRKYVESVFPGIFDRIDDLSDYDDLNGHQLAQRIDLFNQQVLETGLMSAVTRPLKLEALPLLVFGWDDEGLIGALDYAAAAVADLRPALTAQIAGESTLPGVPTPDDDGADSIAASTEPTIDDIIDDRFGLENIAAARVELDRLLCHIEENWNYYLGVSYTAKGLQGWLEVLDGCPQIRPYVEPRLLGIRDGYAIFPLTNRASQMWKIDDVREIVGRVSEAVRDDEPLKVILPTHGTVLESRLGECDACEGFIRDHRTEDVNLKKQEVALATAKARQADAEADRYEARLNAAPPMLDDPDPETEPRIVVRLDSDGADPGSGGSG